MVKTAKMVALNCLEPRAAMYDKLAIYPTDSWTDLSKHGLLSIGIPGKFGGAWTDMSTYVMVIENLSHGCTSSAMTLHMHSVVQMFIEDLASPKQKKKYYAEVVDDAKLFGSWGSEPDAHGGSGIARGTAIAPTSTGYSINGQKHFCTMAGAAYRYMVHCTMKGFDGTDGYQMALVPHAANGIRIDGDWDTLGMRATVSPTVSFQNCEVDADCLLGKPGEALAAGTGNGFALGYAAIYIGAAQKALDFTLEYCKTHQLNPDPKPLSDDILVQRAIAEMSSYLHGARLVLYESASRWQNSTAQARMTLAARSKYLATEAALMITSKCIQTLGGRSGHKSMPLERIFRDIRTATLMPPNSERAMEIIGQNELGLTDSSK